MSSRPDWAASRIESVATIVPGPSGRNLEIQSSARDVTRRLADTAALEASERRWQIAFDSAPVGMAEVGLDGRYLMVNDALCDVLGYRHEDLVGAPVVSICHPDDAAPFADSMTSLAGGLLGVHRAELRCVHRVGHAVWVAVSGVGVAGEGGRAGYVLLHYLDITDRKDSERHLQLRARTRPPMPPG